MPLRKKKSEDKNQVLIDALEFYACKWSWKCMGEYDELSDADIDCGDRAREALEKYRSEIKDEPRRKISKVPKVR